MAKRGNGEGTIAKRPDGTWWARVSVGYDDNGKQKRKAFYGKTRQEVAQKMIEAQNKANKGVCIEPSKMTVGEWMEIWLREYKKNYIKQSTYVRYSTHINCCIIPLLGNIKLKDLRNEHIQKFVNELTDKMNPLTIKTFIGVVLRPALNKAIDNELIVKNPSININYPEYVKRGKRVLTQEEQDRFVEIAKTAYMGEFFILALTTGLRVGEAYVKLKLKNCENIFSYIDFKTARLDFPSAVLLLAS